MKAIKCFLYKYGIKLFGIVLFVFVMFRIDFTQFFIVIKRIDRNNFLLSLLLIFPYLVFKFLRWFYILRMQGIEHSYFILLKIYLSSLFLGIITPGRIGDFAKVVYLKKYYSIPTGKGFSSVFVDRILDLLFLLLISIIGGFVLTHNVNFIFLLLILLAFTIIVLTLSLKKSPSLSFYKIIPKRFIKKGENTYQNFKEGMFSLISARFLLVILISIFVFAIFFIQCYLIGLSLGINIGIIKLSTYISMMSIVTLLPVSISGIGTRDVALIFFFSREGLPEEKAIAFSLLFLFVFSVFAALLGLIGWSLQPAIKLE